MAVTADDSVRKIALAFAWAAAALAAVLVTGSVGYRVLAPGYSWLDCFYMTFITIATTGYAEVVGTAHNPAARLSTVFIAFTGIAITTYIMSVFTAFLIEGRISTALWRSRMEKNIHQSRAHDIVRALRTSNGWLFNPGASVTLHAKDALVVMANPDGRAALEHMFAPVAA
jgi:hypothetical protein